MKKLLALIIGSLALLVAAPASASDSVPRIDWDRDFAPILVEPSMVVRSCEGDAPLVCVTTDDGIHLGRVEHLSYPTELRTIAELKAEVRRFYRSIVADRRTGCGSRYTVKTGAIPVRTVDHAKGVQYTITGINADGTVVERTRGYMAIRNGHLHVLAAAAYDAGGCLANEGEFSVGGLQSFEPAFGALVESTTLRNLP